jgi:predicted transcriptional regulator
VAGNVIRCIRSLGARIRDEDPHTLRHLREIDEELTAAWAMAVEGLREMGFTDGEIAAEIGITRQTVEYRWPRIRTFS